MKFRFLIVFIIVLITGLTFAQERQDKNKQMIVTPDGKIMSIVDGKVITEDITKEITKPDNPINDAPIGTPFSWDNNLNFYAGSIDWTINAIAVSGSDVYIGGNFTDADGNPNGDHIIRYNQKTNTWHPLSTGLNGNVHAITVSGNNVYVGGEFTDAGGNSNADHIALWDGSSWNSLGSGTGLNDAVYAIAVSGSNVFVGGDFIGAGGLFEADHIAKWNGSSWNAIGQLNGTVYAIEIFGSLVHIGGAFTSGSGNSPYLVVYDDLNVQWYGLGSALNGAVYAMDIENTNLYIGGEFINAGGDPNADVVARFNLYNSTEWEALGTSILTYDYYSNRAVKSLAAFGEDLYVGGQFWSPYNSYFNGIAYWNGITWDSLDTGMFFRIVEALALSGTDLLVGSTSEGLERRFGAYAEGLFSGLQNSAASGSGLIEFNTPNDSTRISLNLIEPGKGNGVFNVFCYEDKPAGGGILPVSNHRWIIQNTGFIPTLSYVDIIRIKFSDFVDSSGIINPYSVQIYHRPTPGRGQFTELYTEYDFSTNELWAYINSYGEFAIGIPSTVDGFIDPGEYVNHVEGQNQQTSDGKTWYMNKDEYYFYFAISNYTNGSEAVNIYMDNSSISPVNFPGVGAQTGTGEDGLNVNLPFGAEFFAYVKPAYDEYKHSNSTYWIEDSVANSFIKSYNDPGNMFEFAIPISSLPVSTSQYNNPLRNFNWLGFVSNGVNISSRVPLRPNPYGPQTDLVWYFNVLEYSLPFKDNSYTHIGTSIPNFGAIDCHEFTFYPQDTTIFINRTSGVWNIEDDLWVWGGTLTFQNSDAVNVGGILTAGGTTNFSYNTSDAPLNVKYFLWQWALGGRLSMNSDHYLTFVSDPFNAYGNFQGRDVFQNVVINNPYHVYLGADMKIKESLTLLSGNIQTVTYDTFYVILDTAAVLNGIGGFIQGGLVKYIPISPAPNGSDSPDNIVINFPVGTANGPSPVSIDFSSVTSGGKLTVEAYQNIHPNTINSSETLGRYWRITKDEDLAFTSADITFSYRPEDFNGTTFSEATDEAAMIVGKYDASWSYPSIFSRTPGGINDGGSITISGVTSFSDFTMFKSQLSANVRVFLEGPFSAGSMSTALSNGGSIPLNQPYDIVPWNYNGTETVATIPTLVVDWVLLELRSNTTTTVARRAAFLRSNGTLVDLDGTSNVSFPGVPAGNYYLVVYHRNHLPIMTANPVQVSETPTLYDLSTGLGQAFGTNAMKDLGGGVYGLYTADTDGSGTVNATDRSNTWNQRNLSGYYGTDVDLSGTVNAADRSSVWNNRNISTQVPTPVDEPVIEIVKENNK